MDATCSSFIIVTVVEIVVWVASAIFIWNLFRSNRPPYTAKISRTKQLENIALVAFDALEADDLNTRLAFRDQFFRMFREYFGDDHDHKTY